MERESFESAEIADLLSRHYVAIKVDREERPDVDRVYVSGKRYGYRQSLLLWLCLIVVVLMSALLKIDIICYPL